MKRTVAFFTIAIFLLLVGASCSSRVENAQKVDQLPPIYPDYVEVTVPAGIAPLNFQAADSLAGDIDVGIKGEKKVRVQAAFMRIES